MSYFCLLSYKGTPFYGWQKTKEGPSIEQCLEEALSKIGLSSPQLEAVSRTDRGVHANIQLVKFVARDLPTEKLSYQLNCLLPDAICVHYAGVCPPSFHPTLDCLGKEYHYCITTAAVQLPHQVDFAWHFPYPIRFEQMQNAADLFVGSHDFGAFTNTQKTHTYVSTIRHLEALDIEVKKEQLLFKIKGNAFLYKMARTIVGTLLDVGRGKLKLSDVEALLLGSQRVHAGQTAPPHGLYLKKIFYSKETLSTLNYESWKEEMPLVGVEVEKSGKNATTQEKILRNAGNS